MLCWPSGCGCCALFGSICLRCSRSLLPLSFGWLLVGGCLPLLLCFAVRVVFCAPCFVWWWAFARLVGGSVCGVGHCGLYGRCLGFLVPGCGLFGGVVLGVFVAWVCGRWVFCFCVLGLGLSWAAGLGLVVVGVGGLVGCAVACGGFGGVWLCVSASLCFGGVGLVPALVCRGFFWVRSWFVALVLLCVVWLSFRGLWWSPLLVGCVARGVLGGWGSGFLAGRLVVGFCAGVWLGGWVFVGVGVCFFCVWLVVALVAVCWFVCVGGGFVVCVLLGGFCWLAVCALLGCLGGGFLVFGWGVLPLLRGLWLGLFLPSVALCL